MLVVPELEKELELLGDTADIHKVTIWTLHSPRAGKGWTERSCRLYTSDTYLRCDIFHKICIKKMLPDRPKARVVILHPLFQISWDLFETVEQFCTCYDPVDIESIRQFGELWGRKCRGCGINGMVWRTLCSGWCGNSSTFVLAKHLSPSPGLWLAQTSEFRHCSKLFLLMPSMRYWMISTANFWLACPFPRHADAPEVGSAVHSKLQSLQVSKYPIQWPLTRRSRDPSFALKWNLGIFKTESWNLGIFKTEFWNLQNGILESPEWNLGMSRTEFWNL